MARFFITCENLPQRLARARPRAPASHLELPQAALELSRQAIEHPAAIGGRRHGLGRALGFGMNHLDPPTHRIGTFGLVRRRLGRRIDGAMHVLHGTLHRLLDARTLAQRRQPLIGLLPGLANRADRLASTLLQRNDMRLDIAG